MGKTYDKRFTTPRNVKVVAFITTSGMLQVVPEDRFNSACKNHNVIAERHFTAKTMRSVFRHRQYIEIAAQARQIQG